MLTDPGAYRVKLGLLVNGEAEVLEVRQVLRGQLESQEFRVFEGFLVLMGLLVPRDKWGTGERAGPQDPKGRQEILEDQDQLVFKV